MNDDNPYRFTGQAVEPPSSLPALPPRMRIADLRRLAFYRRLFVPATIVYYADACLLIVYTIAVAYEDTRVWLELNHYVALFGWTAPFALVLLGATAFTWIDLRSSPAKPFLLLVPLLNVFVVGQALRDSRQRLEERGVRHGWFVDDYSRATDVPPVEEATST